MRWLFPVYIAAVIIALFLHKCYRRSHPPKPAQTVCGRVVRGLGRLGVALAIFYAGIMTMFVSSMIYDYYLFFTPARIDKVGEAVGIVIEDGVTPVKYIRMFGGIGEGSSYRLTLRTDLDSDNFIEQCCKGVITEYSENGMVYSTDNRMLGELESDCNAFYVYSYEDYDFTVKFEADGTVDILR